MAKESIVGIRMDAEIKADLQKAAELHGMNLSEYIMHLAMIGIDTVIARKKQIRQLAVQVLNV